MKIGNPVSRSKLKIPSHAYVLDVGCGHNPFSRADVVTDKYIDSNYHRNGNIKVLQKQKFVHADGENLPFRDKEFDYVTCCHVIEHVAAPDKFLNELSRVGKQGYIEAPSMIGEFLIPKDSHKWVLLEIDDRLVFVDKKRLNFKNSINIGTVFQKFLPRHSLAFKILERTHPQILTVNYEWKDSIEYLIEPDDAYLRSFFTESWDEEMCHKIMPKRSIFKECLTTGVVAAEILGRGAFNLLSKQGKSSFST